ncbi:MAG: alkaline shock response membrane anchor protein AmaP [Candidatus Omnitrophota bacterium]|nr:alkaline shock response membrane anchor protein AmaP [Candidatus Omnitrophota bacterium]
MVFLISLIYVLMSFVLGSVLIGLAWNTQPFLLYIHKQLMFVETNAGDMIFRLQFTFIGTLVILLCIRYLETFFFRSQRERSVVLESPQGRVSITLFAIEDMLKKTLEHHHELSHVRPRVIAGKRIVEVVIRGNLTSELNLIEFTSTIQGELREKLQQLLGEDKEIKVRIEIRKMSFSRGNKKLVEEEPEIPFRNY